MATYREIKDIVKRQITSMSRVTDLEVRRKANHSLTGIALRTMDFQVRRRGSRLESTDLEVHRTVQESGLADQRDFDLQAWTKSEHQPWLGYRRFREPLQNEEHRGRRHISVICENRTRNVQRVVVELQCRFR